MDRTIRVYVPLKRQEVERLMDLAQAERRRPAEQAAWLLAPLLAEQAHETEQQDARELMPA